MGSYEALKTAITNAIKQNGNAEITGDLLQQVLLAIVSNIGKGATFAGFATPSTNPGTPDNYVFYLAAKNGTYSNFGGIVLENQLAAFSNKSGEWQADVVDLVTADALDALRTTLQGEIDAEQARAIARENAIEAMFTGDVEEAVNAWLEAHPEATTTVLDNSITLNKLNTEVRQFVGYAKNVLEYPGENFGAKLKAALADETSNTRVFFIPLGEYELTETINIVSCKPFKLIGQPMEVFKDGEGTIINCVGCGMFFIQDVEGVEINNIKIVGDNSEKTCIELFASSLTKLNNLYISNFSIGIKEESSTLNIFSDNIILNCTISVMLNNSVLTKIINTAFESSKEGDFVNIYYGSAISIIGCTLSGPNATAIRIREAEYIQISYCAAQGAATFLESSISKGVEISNPARLIEGSRESNIIVNGGDVRINGVMRQYAKDIIINYSGVLDITDAKFANSKYHITNNSGIVVARQAQYAVGYSLQQDTADATCPVEFNGMLEDVEELNFAGKKVFALNSKYPTGSIDVDRYSPGIKYHFKVPKGYIGKQMWLCMRIERTNATRDLNIALVGANLVNPNIYGDVQIITQTSNYTIGKFATSIEYRNFMLEVTKEDIYVTIYHLPLNIPRSIKFMVEFIYLSEDNSYLLPPDWKPDNKTSGTTDERPTEAKEPGFMYFDTTLSKPIYWNGTTWVDASGNNV